MSFMFSARLARREVRRRPGRTSLVTMLIMVPFVAIGLGATMIRTSDLSSAERNVVAHGTADLVVPVTNMVGSNAFTPGAWIARVLGPDAVWTEIGSAWSALTASVKGADGGTDSRTVTLETFDPEHPVNAGILDSVRGVGATSRDTVVVSANLARLWGLSVGSRLQLIQPDLSFTVVGVARRAEDIRGNRMWITRDNPLYGSFSMGSQWIAIDLPGVAGGDVPKETRELIAQEANSVGAEGAMSDIERAFWSDASALLSGYGSFAPGVDAMGVFAVVAFAVLAVVVSAGFATSARRQLTTVGQLSANGASEREISRSLALQGMWSGLIAVVIGSVPVAWFALGGSGLAERFTNHAVAQMDVPVKTLVWVSIVAVASSTVAAWIPSRSAARISVLDALAGRRPQKAAPRVYAGLGLALFAGGLGLEILAATGTQHADGGSVSAFFYAGIFGGLAILGSIVLLGPVLVQTFDLVGARAAGSVRLAARGLARNRSRSAAVVVSIAAFGALGATASSGYLFSHDPQQVWFPPNVVMEVQRACPDSMETTLECTIADNPVKLSSSIDDIVGEGATSLHIRWASFTAASPFNSSNTQGYVYVHQRMYIESDGLVKAMGISRGDRTALRRNGIIRLMTESDSIKNGFATSPAESLTAVLLTKGGRLEFPTTYLHDRMKWPTNDDFMVTEEFARANALDMQMAGRVLVAAHDLSENQIAKLGILQASYQPWAYGGVTLTMFDDAGKFVESPEEYDPTRPGGPRPEYSVTYNSARPAMDPRVMQSMVAVTILALVAFVVAIGLALMAAEGKDERDVLVSIGSPPAVQARIAGLRAAGLSLLGLALAFPVGVIPTIVSARSSGMLDSGASIWSHVPWSLGAMYVALPAVMLLVAMVASAVAQAIRPVRISNSAFE